MAVLSSKLLAPLLLLADDPVPNVISQFTCCYFIFTLIFLQMRLFSQCNLSIYLLLFYFYTYLSANAALFPM